MNTTESFAESATLFNNYLLREYGTIMFECTLLNWGLTASMTPEEIYNLADDWIREKRAKIQMYHE